MKLPFDVSAKGTLFYYDGRLKNEAFRKEFKEAVLDCLEHPERPDSQVLESMSGRGSLFEIFSRDEAIRRLDAVLSECDWNEKLWDTIILRAQKNQKNRGFIIKRFRTSAVELLVTNRYIDEEPIFFESAELMLGLCHTANEELSGWTYDPDTTEEWFLRTPVGKLRMKTATSLRDKVEEARKNLSKRF